jgi:hypothetical protein
MLQSVTSDLFKAKTPAGHPVLSSELAKCVKILMDENQLYFNKWKITVLVAPKEVELAMDVLEKKAKGEAEPFKEYPFLSDLAPVTFMDVCEQDDRYLEIQQVLYPMEPNQPYPVMGITLIPRVFIKPKLPALVRKKVVIEEKLVEKKVSKKK